MAYLFGRYSPNVLDALNSDKEFEDHFDGGFFDDAESDFLGIAIGKKAKARKKAKRDDRQAARKYKLETERIRALQGQPKQNVIKDIGSSLASVAGSVFGGGAAQTQEETFTENIPASTTMPNYPNSEPKAKNNTIIYIIVGLIVVGAAFYLLKK